MSTKEFDDLDFEDRVVLNNYRAASQNLHTYRRRKFFLDAADHVNNKPGADLPSHWEQLEQELKHQVKQKLAENYPGGDRARLWSQEARYRMAETYSLEYQRRMRTVQSLDTSKVGTVSPRNHYLEPSMPPSYQSRAALALKNEGKVNDQYMESRLQSLIDRAASEVTLDTALHRQKSQSRVAILLKQHASKIQYAQRRGYCTKTPQKSDSSSTTSTNDAASQSADSGAQSTDSVISRFRAWFAKNGPLGVTLYLGYSMVDLTLIYLLLSAGVDVSPVLAFFGFEKGAGAATFAIAYAIHKSLAPLRATLVLMTMPAVKPYWDRAIAVVEKYAIQNDAKIKKFSDRFDGKD